MIKGGIISSVPDSSLKLGCGSQSPGRLELWPRPRKEREVQAEEHLFYTSQVLRDHLGLVEHRPLWSSVGTQVVKEPLGLERDRQFGSSLHSSADWNPAGTDTEWGQELKFRGQFFILGVHL